MGVCDSVCLTTGSSDGVEYSLFDNVKVFDKNFTEPHIGKITQLWEDKASLTTKVLIRWFLRHKEVKPHADDNPKELFLAFGDGKGAVNENDLDVVVGKCKVLCTSKDPRNNQPSVSDIEKSDYYFSHVYDVDLELTFPVEERVEKLGLSAILNKQECVTASSKIEEKESDPRKSETPKNGAKKVIPAGSTGTDLKKIPKDVEKSTNSVKKRVTQEGYLKKGQLSSDESSKKSKLMSSDSALLQEENQEKGGENLTEPSTVLPHQGSNTGDVIGEKSQVTNVESHAGDGDLLLGKAEKGDRVSLKECATQENISIGQKISTLENFPLHVKSVDSPKQHAVNEFPQSGIDVKQGNDTVKLDEEAPNKENTLSKDTQKLEVRDVLNLEETDLGFMEEEQHSRLLSKRARSDSTEKVEAEIGQKVDLAKEGISKKMKMGTDSETEKRPMATIEMARATEKRKIFKKLPWEVSLEQGISNGKVLLLQNFDPWTTSADVRDLLESTFHGLLDARTLPQESICSSCQALAIFETKGMADAALEAMEKKCLVVAYNRRPVIATRVKESTSQLSFPGHLALDKLKLGKSVSSEEYKKAVSTSHSSQPNTIEFDMAMEWRQLQEITQNCRVELFKKQRKEIHDLKTGNLSKGQKSKQESP